MNAVSIIGVVSAFGLVCLWLLALCAEKGILPLGRIRQGGRRLPAWKKVLILIFVSVWIAFAGTKDGTNQMENVELKMENGIRADSIFHSPFYTLHSDVQGLSTAITADDVAQMWRIGATVEGNAIVAPSANAVTNAAWLDYGGMSDTFRLLPEGWRFPFAEKTMTGLTVFENGEFRPNVKAHFFPPPFDAKLSFLPRMNWGLLPNGGESACQM